MKQFITRDNKTAIKIDIHEDNILIWQLIDREWKPASRIMGDLNQKFEWNS